MIFKTALFIGISPDLFLDNFHAEVGFNFRPGDHRQNVDSRQSDLQGKSGGMRTLTLILQ